MLCGYCWWQLYEFEQFCDVLLCMCVFDFVIECEWLCECVFDGMYWIECGIGVLEYDLYVVMLFFCVFVDIVCEWYVVEQDFVVGCWYEVCDYFCECCFVGIGFVDYVDGLFVFDVQVDFMQDYFCGLVVCCVVVVIGDCVVYVEQWCWCGWLLYFFVMFGIVWCDCCDQVLCVWMCWCMQDLFGCICFVDYVVVQYDDLVGYLCDYGQVV